MSESSELLEQQLEVFERIHKARTDAGNDALIHFIREFRVTRMQQTYADLHDNHRYRQAVDFLLQDLLGAKDLSRQGLALRRAKSTMVRVLPDALLATVAKAVQLAALTLELDMRLAADLKSAGAEQATITRQLVEAEMGVSELQAQYLQQTELVCIVGVEIESVVHKPFVATALKMCRKPAKLMGLAELQDYLERGFHAFRSMGGAREFLDCFRQREHEFLQRIFKQSNAKVLK